MRVLTIMKGKAIKIRITKITKVTSRDNIIINKDRTTKLIKIIRIIARDNNKSLRLISNNKGIITDNKYRLLARIITKDLNRIIIDTIIAIKNR